MKPTKEQILVMEPGRELDALVLECVFGFPRKRMFPPEYWEEGDNPFLCYWFIPSGKPKRTHMIDARMVPDFSRSISAAWQIVDKLVNTGYCPSILFDDDGHWCMSLSGIGGVGHSFSAPNTDDDTIWCDTAPEAISKTALLAMSYSTITASL